MIKLTFDNICKCLQYHGVRCYHIPAGIKVYSQYSHLGTFLARSGRCVFTGSVHINFKDTQSCMHELLNLFECDKVAFVADDDYIEYRCHIKAIKEVLDE